MAFLIAWLSLGACLILSVAIVALTYDARGQRRAFGVAEGTIATLQRRVAAQEAAIGRLTGAVAAHAPLRLVHDASQRRAIEPPPDFTDRVMRAIETEEEERLRRLLRASLFCDGTTLEQRLQEKFRSILHEERYPNVRHCAGTACCPGPWDVCACPCSGCGVRRFALSRAQRIFGEHVPFVQLPDEPPEVWALRRDDEDPDPGRPAA